MPGDIQKLITGFQRFRAEHFGAGDTVYERLTREERRVERLLLGLRVVSGVPRAWVGEEAGLFVEQGLAELRDGRFALTDRGMFLANEVVLALAD